MGHVSDARKETKSSSESESSVVMSSGVLAKPGIVKSLCARESLNNAEAPSTSVFAGAIGYLAYMVELRGVLTSCLVRPSSVTSRILLYGTAPPR